MQTAVIFGAGGQDGLYMAELCKKQNIHVVCISRNYQFADKGSVADRNLVTSVITKYKPEYIFHFAANSTTRHDALFENHETISGGTLNILEAVKIHSPLSKVLIVGSGVQFLNKGEPISENDAFDASSPYSVSRIQSVYAARYFRSLGIKVYVAYLFHHESPFRHPNHLSKIITNKIKEIKNGEAVKIVIGDLNVTKEWAFAKDIVNGIFTLVNQEAIWEATIGTGEAYSVKNFLDICMEESKLDFDEHVESKNNYKAEFSTLVSDPSTINSLGWKPETDLRSLARILLS